MKYITFIFFFLFVSCEDCIDADPSTSYDRRCKKLQDKAIKKGRETGVCYQPPEDAPPITAREARRLDPDPKACKALIEELRKKCDALPPAGPGDIVYTSGSAFYKSGRPICPPSKK